MKLKDFVKNKTDKIVSLLSKGRHFHNYKYCASVQITPDVDSIIKRRKQVEVKNTNKIRLFR